MTTRLGLALLLSLLAGAALWQPGEGLRLTIDASSAAIGTPASSQRERLLASVTTATVFDRASLLMLDGLTRRLARLPGVWSVRSAVGAELPASQDEDIDVASLADRLRRDPDAAEAWIDRILGDPMLAGRLVSTSRDALAIVVEVDGESEAERAEATERVVAALESGLADHPALGLRITGGPLIKQTIGVLLIEQMLFVLPITILVFAVLLWSAFRHLLTVVACVLTMAASMAWTLGFAAAIGWGLNLVTILIPPLVMALSVAYCMHVVSEFAAVGKLDEALRSIRLPLAITAVTTAIGLGALALNPLYSVKQFAALGAFAALASALAAECVLGGLLGLGRRVPSMWPRADSAMVRGANLLAGTAVRHARRMLAGGVAVLIVALIGASQVEPGARYIRDLPESTPARADFEAINAAFGGTNTFRIEIRATGTDAALLPEVLNTVDALQAWLARQPEVGTSLSLVDYVKRVNQAFAGGDIGAYRVPQDAALTKQLMMIAAPEDAYAYTDLNFTRILVEVSSPETDTARLSALLRRLDARLAELPPGLTVSLSGAAVDLTRTIESLTAGQLQSIGLASLAIFGVLCLLFASVKVGALAMLPNVLPVAVYFGLLGFTGTPLGPTTALVACIVLGIAVDDTLHLLVRFNRLARDYADEVRAAREAAAQVIRPITLTTVAVCCGFLALVNSPFHSQVVFGVMAAVTLLIAWASDLLLVPAVGARATIVTLWDTLRVDLGEAPQRTIPLLAGMSARQARLFALATNIRTVPDGDRLIRQGDAGTEMYVVVEGKVRIWIERPDGSAMPIGEQGRGTTLGEAGNFSRRRTANVTAVGATRVLAFSGDDLERLRRVHPRIAALAYRNLNRIQAERLAGTTERLAELGERSTDRGTRSAND